LGTITRTRRVDAPRIAVFNHKGGVGKTTLTVNLAIAIAERGQNVLLVDSDPQCNLTSYLVEEAVVNDILDHSDTDQGRTLWSALKPVVEGSGDPNIIAPYGTPYGVDLLPGDVRVAEFESELAGLWGECFQRKLRGFRGTTALSSLVNEIARAQGSTVILYDTGPNIGPLNRVISLDCDYFITPVACDLFSMRALQTLGHTLTNWISDWRQIEELAPREVTYLLPGRPKPLGYVAQRFRVYSHRPALTYAQYLPRIEKAFSDDLLAVLARQDGSLVASARAPLRIADIQDYGAIANAAQREGVPLWQTNQGTPQQREVPHRDFAAFAATVLQRTGLEAPRLEAPK
jgi:cellulose biosynthesis protein BcsQ